MTLRRLRWLLFAIFLIGTATRVQHWYLGPRLYPDAYFQYLEPAWTRVSGFGMQTWEWRDGIRSWVLPSYHGAWMALLSSLSVKGSVIGSIIQLHWGLWSLFLVWAAWRGGCLIGRQASRRSAGDPNRPLFDPVSERDSFAARAPEGWQAGVLAALLMALFPLLAVYSNEPLTELPSMIGLVCGLVLTAELVERQRSASPRVAALVGFIVSLAVCLRVVNGALALIPPLWLLVRGPRRMLLPMALGALLPVIVFGAVDRLTWGTFFGSFIKYVRFNVIEGRAAEFGTAPARWYIDKLQARAPIGIWLMLVPALFGVRVTWPHVLSALGILALISSQAHKEERFAIIIWPLLIIAAAGSAGRWLRPPQPSRTPRDELLWPALPQVLYRIRQALVLGAAVFVIAEAQQHLGNYDYALPRGRYDGQAWVGRQPDATGVLLDWNFYTGGYLWLDNTLPQLKFESALLSNPIFSHVIAPKGSSEVTQAKRAGFEVAYERDPILVLRRKR
ncbi:MAG TPA: hypothetical protein VIV60_23525 [Polyangiaceae bacterium]